MPNPLDPIWDAHSTTRSALKVVKRCVTVAGIDRAKAFSNTRFGGLTDQQCIDLFDAAQTDLDDAAILSLYATFEARLRDHVSRQAHLLQAGQQPSPDFGQALAASFAEYSARNRMDDVAGLFATVVG